VLKASFEGVLRWHAKRTLREVPLVLGIEREGTILGFALVETLVPEVGFVHYIAVSSADRRKGLGGILLDEAIRRFRAERVEVVFASIEGENRASQALFESRGFRATERKERTYRERGLGAWGLRSRMRVLSGEILFGRRIRAQRRASVVPLTSSRRPSLGE
jgi:L-amino acid N-acyltransferase YncA